MFLVHVVCTILEEKSRTQHIQELVVVLLDRFNTPVLWSSDPQCCLI